jgi:cytochrome c oxidase assembly factor CtaG
MIEGEYHKLKFGLTMALIALVFLGIGAVQKTLTYIQAYTQTYVTESQMTDACSCQSGGIMMVKGEDYVQVVSTSESYYYITPDGKKLWEQDVLEQCLHGRADTAAWNAVFGIE